MVRFKNWYNQPYPMHDDQMMSGRARAGIAHLWFGTIHPFDDENGRVGRAISDHALSQSLGGPTTACRSMVIREDNQFYYLQMEKASRSSLDANDWLDYFADRVIKAQAIA